MEAGVRPEVSVCGGQGQPSSPLSRPTLNAWYQPIKAGLRARKIRCTAAGRSTAPRPPSGLSTVEVAPSPLDVNCKCTSGFAPNGPSYERRQPLQKPLATLLMCLARSGSFRRSAKQNVSHEIQATRPQTAAMVAGVPICFSCFVATDEGARAEEQNHGLERCYRTAHRHFG